MTRLRDVLASSSMSDILCSFQELPVKIKHKKHRSPKPVDRSKQGAALSGHPNVPLDKTSEAVVRSDSSAPITVPTSDAPAAQKVRKTMQLTLKSLNRKGTTAIYAGTLGAVRIGLMAFPNKTAPETIEVADGVFAVKVPKAPRVKLTKEERAALPKPTAAEKIAAMEARLAAAKAKLAAEANEL